MDMTAEETRSKTQAEMLALLPRLRRFALALTGQPADADDLVQDTVERALRNLSKWRPGSRLDSWMYRIAQNVWIDRTRYRRLRAPHAEPLEAAGGQAFDGLRAAEASLTLARTLEALQALPEEQRAVAALVLIEGVAYRDAAEILDLPIGTVMSRLARAREALARRVLGGDASEGSMP
jgi:RNA polymerase sigma-70 factor (ECF subfamily)